MTPYEQGYVAAMKVAGIGHRMLGGAAFTAPVVGLGAAVQDRGTIAKALDGGDENRIGRGATGAAIGAGLGAGWGAISPIVDLDDVVDSAPMFDDIGKGIVKGVKTLRKAL